MNYVLGILGQPRPRRRHPFDITGDWESGYYHDAAAVLLRDGEVVAAVEEERLTRRKHTGKFPEGAIQACLEIGGITLDGVDLIAFGERGGVGPGRDATISPASIGRLLTDLFSPRRPVAERVITVDHHLCHAVSAVACSGFGDGLVFTSDGFGDGVSGTVMLATDGQLTQRATISMDDSLGQFYAAAMPYLGFPSVGDEYKVMGLAPYGDPSVHRAWLQQFVDKRDDGGFTIRRRAMVARLTELGRARDKDDPIEQRHMDVAAAIQDVFEDLSMHLLRHHLEATGRTRLALAGGTAQNSSFNGKLIRSGIFEDVFIQPAAHDSGVPLGAALHAWARQQGRDYVVGPRQGAASFGRHLGSDDSVVERLARWSDLVDVEQHEDIEDVAAELLVSGEVIGWAQGRSEFGPRALGFRSILADPRPASNKDVVNAMVKKREAFRPFAPAVPEEDAAVFFETEGRPFPLMTAVVFVREQHRSSLGAVTHVDGTARIQTVAAKDNPRFWKLLKAFGERTGVPVLLNTSFNNHAEPIVESVDEAVACFLTTGLTRLVVGRSVVVKRPMDPSKLLDLQLDVPRDVALISCQGTHGGIDLGWGSFLARGELAPLDDGMAAVIKLSRPGAPVRAAIEQAGLTARADEIAGRLLDLWSSRLVRLRPISRD